MRPGPIFLGLALAAALAGTAVGQAQRFKTAAWVGGPLYTASQQFGTCFVSRSYPDGGRVDIQLSPQLRMWVGASKATWNLTPNQEFEMIFEINEFKKKFSGKSDTQNRSMIWFEVGNDPDLRRALAGNGTMTWVDPKGLRFVFDLANSDNAMRKLLACTALYGMD